MDHCVELITEYRLLDKHAKFGMERELPGVLNHAREGEKRNMMHLVLVIMNVIK